MKYGEYITAVMTYILSTYRTTEPKKMINMLAQNQSVNAVMTTVADYIRQEGIQQGASTLLKRQLMAKFKTLPAEYLQKVDSADAETLETWSIRILDTNSPEDIFK